MILKNHKVQPSTLHMIGQKVRHAAEFIAMAKGAWDIGRSVYHGAQALALVIGPAIGAALIYLTQQRLSIRYGYSGPAIGALL